MAILEQSVATKHVSEKNGKKTKKNVKDCIKQHPQCFLLPFGPASWGPNSTRPFPLCVTNVFGAFSVGNESNYVHVAGMPSVQALVELDIIVNIFSLIII